MTPLYEMYHNRMINNSYMNPMQRMMQAMSNPAAFVKNAFPDIPDGIQNNPSQILQYLQQTRNIPNSQIQNIFNQMQNFR